MTDSVARRVTATSRLSADRVTLAYEGHVVAAGLSLVLDLVARLNHESGRTVVGPNACGNTMRD